MHHPCGVIIRIEEEVKAVIENAVSGQKWLEHEMLEKPGGVGQVPLGRADIRHALDHEIFGFEAPAQFYGSRSNHMERRGQGSHVRECFSLLQWLNREFAI